MSQNSKWAAWQQLKQKPNTLIIEAPINTVNVEIVGEELLSVEIDEESVSVETVEVTEPIEEVKPTTKKKGKITNE